MPSFSPSPQACILGRLYPYRHARRRHQFPKSVCRRRSHSAPRAALCLCIMVQPTILTMILKMQLLTLPSAAELSRRGVCLSINYFDYYPKKTVFTQCLEACFFSHPKFFIQRKLPCDFGSRALLQSIDFSNDVYMYPHVHVENLIWHNKIRSCPFSVPLLLHQHAEDGAPLGALGLVGEQEIVRPVGGFEAHTKCEGAGVPLLI